MSTPLNRRGLSAPALLWRQLSTQASASLGVALLVVAGAVVGMAAPRAMEQLNSASTQQRISELAAPQRDLVADAAGGPETGPMPPGFDSDSVPPNGPDSRLGLPTGVAEVWGKQEASLRGIRSTFSPLLKRTFGDPQYTVQFGAMWAAKPGAGPSSPVHRVLPTFDPRMPERVRFVEGAAPATDATLLPREAALEIALSKQTSAEMNWPLGEERWVDLGGPGRQQLRLAGIYEAVDSSDPYWQHTLAALASSITEDGINAPQYTSVAFIDPASWAAFGAIPIPPQSHIWYPLQLDALRSPDTASLLVALREVAANPVAIDSGMQYNRFQPTPPGEPEPPPTIPSIGIAELNSAAVQPLERAERANTALLTVLALTAAGPLGVMTAVLALGTGVVANRRKRSMTLAAARGASRAQLGFILGLEGAIIGVPAAVIGAAVGAWLVPNAEASPVGIVCAVILGATPLCVLLLRGSRFEAEIGPSNGRGARARPQLRWTVELAVIGLAAAGVATVLTRGHDSSSAAVDPLLAATPLLLSLAVCVVVLRVYPLPLAALSRLAARRRGLVAALGSRRALREPSTGFAPVLALVVGISITVFSSVMLTTVQNGVQQAAAERVGADMRLTAPPMTADHIELLRQIPGIEAIAPVYSSRSVLISAGGSHTSAVLLVVDSAELNAVQYRGPDAAPLPTELSDPVSSQPESPIPAVISRSAASFLDNAVDFQIGSSSAERLATLPELSPFTSTARWLMIDKVNAASHTQSLTPRLVLIDVAPDAEATVVAEHLVELLGDDIEVAVPSEVADEIQRNPSIAGLQAALAIAIALSALLSAAAVVITLALGATARERLLGMLRVLGLTRIQASSLVLWEIGPIAVVSIVVGSVLGLCLPLVVLAGVDLTPFTGGSMQPTASVDPLLIAASIGLFVLVVAAASATALVLARRAGLARAIRLEEE